ncbi:MAG: phosphate regulon sensor histidine kinase PhoR, partial [Acidithiobacillus ferrivorans]
EKRWTDDDWHGSLCAFSLSPRPLLPFSGVKYLRAWFYPVALWALIPIFLAADDLRAWSYLPPVIIAFLLALWVGWHRQQSQSFSAWFRNPDTLLPPLAGGMWEETFAEGYHWRRDQEAQHRLLSAQIVQLRDALQAMPDVVVLMDARGQLLWVNPSGIRLLQLQWPEDAGKPLAFWLRTPNLRAFLAGEGPPSLQLPAPADAQQILEGMRYPLADAGALVIFRDVTRIRQLEQVRQDFVANVSHELRSPLTVVRGFLENMLDSSIAADDEVSSQLRLMEQQTLRMQSLVEDLLSLARMEAAEANPEHCETLMLADMVHNMLNTMAPAIAQKHLQINTVLDGDLGFFAETIDLTSIIRNLLENAIKYTPANRTVNVRWERRPGELLFVVQDTGDGIAAEHLQRITERFYRVDKGRSRRIGGTGLGLAIVRHAVERYQGHLEVASEVGKGSAFTAHFPLHLARSVVPDSAVS